MAFLDLLFGSDPGRKAGKGLSEFGMTGKLGGQSQEELLNSIIGSQPAEARMATGQRLARSGLTGSGIAEDTMGNVDLQTADSLRKARFGLLSQRLRAMGIASQMPRQQGLLQTGAQGAFDFLTARELAKGTK